MLKLVGALVIILSCGLIGVMIARSYSLRPADLRNLQAALQMLETEINYAATPLAEALRSIAARADKRVTPLFASALAELRTTPGCTAREAWEKALKTFYPQTALLKSDLAILSNLGRALGISDRQDQTRHLRLAIDQIGAEIDRAQNEAARHVKLWNYLGFLGGLIIVLLLY
ncbi:MAG: stage III sporulation protein SpoIIIAB [Bacillota bacterium]